VQKAPQRRNPAQVQVRRLGLEVLHVLALSSFAIAQPLYDVLADHPQFFVSRGSEAIDVALFVLGVSFVVPAAAVLVLGLSAWIGGRTERASMLGIVAVLAACTAMPPLNRLGTSATLAIGAAAAIGLVSAAAYARLPVIRSFVTALAVCVVAYPAYFVLATPIAKLAFPGAPTVLAAASGVPDTPVIFVLFDLLPTTSLMDERREIDAERFPNFGALAKQSTWYRNATTVAPDTVRSVAAITTGLRPEPGKLALAVDYPANLFTFLAPSHELFVMESQTKLCPVALCEPWIVADPGVRLRGLVDDTWILFQHLVVPESLRTGTPPIRTGWHGFAAGEPGPAARRADLRKVRRRGNRERNRGTYGDRGAKFMRFHDGLHADREPMLAYLHLALPHDPYVFLPSGRTYVPRGRLGRSMRADLRRDGSLGRVRLANQRLTLQIGYADTLLGYLLERLRDLALYERALIVVVADHGASYTEGRATRLATDGGTIFVPLFVKLPGQERGVIDDRNAETIDILPTIADALGAELPIPVDGRSLLGPDDGRVRPKQILHSYQPGVVSHGAWQHLLDDSLRRKLRLTSTGPMDTIFRTGPYGELVGRTVEELRNGVPTREGTVWLVPGVAGRVQLDQQSYLREVAPGSLFVPAYLTGELLPADGASYSRDLVVAVNGVVRTTARTAPGVRGPSLALLIPESSLKPGRNQLAFFVARLAGENRVELRQAELRAERPNDP